MLRFFYNMWSYFIPIHTNRLLFLHSVILIHWKGCNTCFCFKMIVCTEKCMLLDSPGWERCRKIKIFYPKKPTAYTPLLHNRDENHAQRLWRSSPVVYRAGLVHRDRWIHLDRWIQSRQKYSSTKLLPRTTHYSLPFLVSFFRKPLSLSNWKPCSSLK